MKASLPPDESQRLVALRACQALDSAPEEHYDDIVRLAAHICGVPIAAVSLIDAERQYLKSVLGLDTRESSRETAFCAHTILQADVMIVPDACDDVRFADNPLVTGDPNIRFYAGAPLVTSDGYALGSLCVIDRVPRQLTVHQEETLRVLARQVSSQLEAACRLDERERLIQAREQVEAENRRLAFIVASSTDAIWSVTLESRITSWNAGAERLYGYAPEEVLGQHQSMLLQREESGFLPEIVQALQRGETRENLEVRRRRKDGVWMDVSLTFSPLRDASGVMIGVSACARDITRQKQSEAALQKEREFVRALLESLQEGIVACDADGTLTLFNRATRELHGLPEQALPPEQWAEHFDLCHADGMTPMQMCDIPLFRALQGEVLRDAEMTITPKSGATRTLFANGQAIYDGDGAKIGAVVAMHDVTERRQMERELARLAAIVESSKEAILGATMDGTLVAWNAGAEHLYGYTAAEMVGQHVSVLAAPTGESPVPNVIARLQRGEVVEVMEVVRRRPNGAVIDVSLSFSPIKNAGGEMIGLSCISRDITDLKKAEAALAESEARLRRLSDAAFEGISISQDGALVDVNSAFAALFGYSSAGEMIGTAAEQLVTPESQALVLQKIAAGDEDSYEAVLQRLDGTTFVAEIRGRMTRHGGRLARITAVHDITERRRQEAALRESEACFRTSVDTMEEGLVLQDAEGAILICNESAERILGLSADQMRGRTSLDPRWGTVHEDGTDFPGDAHPAMAALREGIAQRNVVMGIRKPDDSEMTWVSVNAVPLRDAGQEKARGVVVTFADITERRRAESALQESSRALRAVLESAPVILYTADAAGRITLWEGTGLAALGLSPGEAVGRSVFEFSGGDPGLEANTRRALAGEAVSYDAHVYGLHLHTEVRPLRDADGLLSGIIGVSFDVTERVASEERFRVLFEQSSDAHLLCDANGIIDCNDATVDLLHYTDSSEVLRLRPDVFSPEFQPDGRRSGEKYSAMEDIARREGCHRFEWTHRKRDGEEFPVEVTLTPVLLNTGPALLAVLHDLTERKRAEQQIKDYSIVLEHQKNELERANAELESLAMTDGLTGLKNHRAFQGRLSEEISRATRYGTPLSVIMLDVDRFKQFNDTYGHPAGDAVLSRVARVLLENARETDVAARYGGEEFCLVLPQTDGAGAAIIAERIRAAIEAVPWPLRAVTASLGIAVLGLDGGDTLVARADDALYRAKEGGRNRVMRARDSAPV